MSSVLIIMLSFIIYLYFKINKDEFVSKIILNNILII